MSVKLLQLCAPTCRKLVSTLVYLLLFIGVPFQIEGNWASLKAASHSFQKIGVTLKHRGQL